MSPQLAADNLVKWSSTNGLVMKDSKTKEVDIYFGRKFSNENDLPHAVMNNRIIDFADSLKLLGANV
jgi:hypothetical protein